MSNSQEPFKIVAILKTMGFLNLVDLRNLRKLILKGFKLSKKERNNEM